MPIYEYVCPKCEIKTEVMQGINDEPLNKCDDCGGEIHRIISHSAFHLKGTGWYKTDYSDKDKARKEANNKKSDEKKPSPPKSEACASCPGQAACS